VKPKNRPNEQPGLVSAGSILSGRFVAPITVTPILWSKPIVTIENYASRKYRDHQDIVN
jgi:ABC-type protease/lipase transport system fused ATPase/permease subunit